MFVIKVWSFCILIKILFCSLLNIYMSIFFIFMTVLRLFCNGTSAFSTYFSRQNFWSKLVNLIPFLKEAFISALTFCACNFFNLVQQLLCSWQCLRTRVVLFCQSNGLQVFLSEPLWGQGVDALELGCLPSSEYTPIELSSWVKVDTFLLSWGWFPYYLTLLRSCFTALWLLLNFGKR